MPFDPTNGLGLADADMGISVNAADLLSSLFRFGPERGESGRPLVKIAVRRCSYVDDYSGERYPGVASNYLCDRRPGEAWWFEVLPESNVVYARLRRMDLVSNGKLITEFYRDLFSQQVKRAQPNTMLVVGNTVATSHPGHLMKHNPEIDVAVIGEGERDEAPMLYIGEEVGGGAFSDEARSEFPEVDIAVDPLEGTNLCATGSEAFRNACYAVAAGAYDVAMAIGVEKLKDTGYGGLLNVQHTVRGYERAGAVAIQLDDGGQTIEAVPEHQYTWKGGILVRLAMSRTGS